MVEKRIDIDMIRPDGPIRDDADRLSRYLDVEDLVRIELVQLRQKAAALQTNLEVINMACEMLEKKYQIKGR